MINHLINLFYPQTCAGCDLVLSAGELSICVSCRHRFPLTYHHANRENEAYKRFYGRLPIEHASAMCYFHKGGIVQEIIHKLKYKGQRDVGTAIGRWYGSVLRNSGALADVTAVVPVPLHKKRLRERGYNQVSAFAMAMAIELGANYSENTLKRNTYARTQTKKDLLERSSSNSIFSANAHFNSPQHILLVDDVMTTGATLEACGKALLTIPGIRISIACIAFAHS